MKKIFLIFTYFYLLLFHVQANANEVQVLNTIAQSPNKEEVILITELILPKNTYTYAPNYKTYPTKITIDSIINESVKLYYPNVKTSHDPLTDTYLQLYSDRIPYYIFIDKKDLDLSSKNKDLQISFLLCSPSNCTPYSKEINLNYPDNLDDLEIISPNEYNKLLNTFLSVNIEDNKDKKTISSANTTDNKTFDFIVRPYSNTIEATNLSLALLLGFIAGLLLNLMPCVLPVIAIKLASLVQTVNQNSEEKHSLIRTYSIFYAFGILSLFSLLAVFVGYFDMMWGQIFQNTYFIIILTGLIFMFALSLLGVFYFPLFNISVKTKNYPRLESYLQGFLATLVATPCSGPLLGGVLAFSLTLPLHLLIIVFLATGLGMASPYLVLAIYPNSMRFIPKTGAWTKTLEKCIAYIFIITCLYLLSLLPESLLYKSIVYLFFVSFFIFLYSLVSQRKHALIYAFVLFCIHSFCSYSLFHPDKESDVLVWKSYSYSSFKENIGQEALLVNFTASWCPTCKVIEKTVLNDKNLQGLVDKYNLKLITVDMTNENSEHSQLLSALNSASIPLVAIFPKGITAYSPILLRDVFTSKQLKKALEENL